MQMIMILHIASVSIQISILITVAIQIFDADQSSCREFARLALCKQAGCHWHSHADGRIWVNLHAGDCIRVH